MSRLFAGTSGFAYPNWKPAFYPNKLPQSKFLAHYATRLNAVEINYTFRRLPAARTLASWVESTPPEFLFCVKAHQKITHILRLRDAADAVAVFLRAIDPLRSARRLGPVLFQLPPQLRCDTGLLTVFLDLLPNDIRFAFEFRNESWLQDSVYTLLSERNIALCVAKSDRLEVPEIYTADFVYFRLRKPDYSEEDLKEIQSRTESLLSAGHDLFVFFKHEEDPDSALSAERLLASVRAGKAE